MSWLGQLGATIFMVIGSIFGFSHPAGVQSLPQNGGQQPTAAQSGPRQSTRLPQSTPGGPPTSGGAQSDAADALMRQVGCSDASSCASACIRAGMTQACEQLQKLMASDTQRLPRSSGTPGSSGGPGMMDSSSRDFAAVGDNGTASASALPPCPSGNALFDHLPMNAGDLAGVEALGHMNGEHILPNQADHVYLQSNSSGNTVIYAPGDATLLQVDKTVGIAGADKGENSVKLFFSPCKSVMFALQMHALSPRLEDALASMRPSGTQTGATVSNTMYGNLNIAIKSGEELGTAVGANGYGAEADFAAADVRTTPLKFIDQSEATGMLADSYQHAVCPLDYFTDAPRSTLYGLLTMKHAGANGIPACGAVMQDKAGTAQGNWYNKSDGATSYQGINESARLAIVHSNLDASKGVVSVGTDLIPSPYLGTQLVFQPQSSGYINREPGEIAPDGHVYCFEGGVGAGGGGAEGHVDIRLDSATSLEADYAPGACSASPSSANAIRYQR